VVQEPQSGHPLHALPEVQIGTAAGPGLRARPRAAPLVLPDHHPCRRSDRRAAGSSCSRVRVRDTWLADEMAPHRPEGCRPRPPELTPNFDHVVTHGCRLRRLPVPERDLVPGPGHRVSDKSLDGEGPLRRRRFASPRREHRPVEPMSYWPGGSLESRTAPPRPLNSRVSFTSPCRTGQEMVSPLSLVGLLAVCRVSLRRSSPDGRLRIRCAVAHGSRVKIGGRRSTPCVSYTCYLGRWSRPHYPLCCHQRS